MRVETRALWTCDRCGHEQEGPPFELPPRWVVRDDDDLCPTCAQETLAAFESRLIG